MKDYSKYIGIPFKKKNLQMVGDGLTDDTDAIRNALSKGIDCYDLIVLLYKDFHGIDLPIYNSPSSPQDIDVLTKAEKSKWIECDLEEGAVILFSIQGYGSHVAYYAGNDWVIHASEGTGSVIMERLSFTWKNRIMGVYKWQAN